MRRSEVLAEESIVCLQRALTHLREIWELIGIPEEQRLQRTEVVKKHIKDLLDRMIAEEESLRERLLKSISICQKELSTLCSELQVKPYQEEKEITVLQLEKDLRTQVELMRKQKKERKQELKLLQEQDQELCEILCLSLYDVESSSVPTLEELNQFRQRVATLKETKESRHEQFVSIKRQIILCMEELEHTPDTSFEKDVVCEDESAFCLSLENIATLQKLLQQLEIKKSKNEAGCEGLRAQIRELWDRLQIPEEEREPVAAIMTGSKAKVRNALQLEVDRLEELKMQKNIKQVIETIRVELARFWDQCFYSQEQRQAFAPYYSEDYTESLLHLHDAEIIRLRSHYEVHKELFEGVQKWEESWKLFLEFERKASDPSRFTNRGGNLLKEEKERAKLQKTLPKLEEELKARIEKWEQEQSVAFVVNGQKFMEYVTEQWELHRLEKERAKQERQLKNKKQTETEMLYGSAPQTPCKRPGMTPNKPGKVRKMNTTTMSSATPNSSIRPVFGTMYHSPVSRPPPGSKAVATSMCSGKKTPRAAQLRANKENMELNGSILSGGYSGSTPLQHNCSIKSVASTYSEFSDTSSDKSLKVLLNAEDKVFNEIRNEHFSNVFGFLSQKARNLQAQYDRRRGMDIKQMKNFVSQELKGLKQEHRLLSLHIGACESIMKKKTKQDFQELIKTEHALLEGFNIRESTSYIEEHIDRQVSPIESLRLMCLLSITENGLIPKDYRSLKTQYLQSYGPEHLLTFSNLRRAGLLTEQAPGDTLTAVENKVSKLVTDKAAGKITDAFSSLAKRSNFRAISKKLNLIPRVDGEYDLKVPRDMAYVFSGAYVPLSCRLIEQVLERRSWQGLDEVVRLLNCTEFAFTDMAKEDKASSESLRLIMVVFLGGCTFSEISALRFLGREKGYRFIFLTTAVTNSARLMEAMSEMKA